jgi:hypothetical protein
LSRFEKRYESDILKLAASASNAAITPETRTYAIHVNQWISHILLTTTINIAAAMTPTREIRDDTAKFYIPIGFFYNRRALAMIIDDISDYVSFPVNKHEENAY